VGYESSDDACVYRLNDEQAVVQTVDFFPPMVDDPFLFGQIAAANALSDVYAMGARPTHAMNLLCFPNCLPLEIAGQILAGGADKCRECGCVVAGGHSIADNEPKFGLCVSGIVHPARILANSSAKAGDKLILTKAIGTGVITTAVKGGLLGDEELMMAVDSMRTLNKYASEVAENFTVHSCTDITGFGAAGHICEMAEGSDLTAVISASKMPFLPKSIEMAAMGMLPGGAYRNRDYFQGRVKSDDDVSREAMDLLFDPQTSGGLLFAVVPEEADALLAALHEANVIAALVGEIVEKEDCAVHVIA